MKDGIWAHATKNDPCPICGKTDWCTFGGKAMLCQRVQSTHPATKGGWYHFYDEGGGYRPPVVSRKAPPRPLENAAVIMQVNRSITTMAQFNSLGESLGVEPSSIIALGAAWSPAHKAWAFPMYDGAGNIVGIRLRSISGFKWAIPGSRQGVFVPMPAVKHNRVVFLPEGPTDTAAALSLGFYAVGRPTCNFDSSIMRDTLKRLGIFNVVIVEDNDEPVKATGKRPGREGAEKLKRELGLMSVFWKPPAPLKDLRAFVKAGGTAQMIQTEIDKKVWSKK